MSDDTTATDPTRSPRPDGTERDAASRAVPTVVPPAADPERCPYCDRPLPGERLLALHLGERHADRLTDDERAAYAAADDAESDDLFVYHLKVVALIVVVVMGLSYVYAFALV
jgi:hypothetical protein